VIQGVLHLLLLSMSAHITKQLGMAPGGEFRIAFREVCFYPLIILAYTSERLGNAVPFFVICFLRNDCELCAYV